MHRSGPRQPHADGSDLSGPDTVRINPDAGVASQTTGCQPQLGQHVDQQLLDSRHIGRRIGHPAAAPTGNGENGIADQLPRPVIGHLAAAVGLHHRTAERLDVDE